MALEKEIKEKVNDYTGWIDFVQELMVYGWAFNKANPEERVEVVVLVDGKPVAEGIADQYREDLKQAGIGDGKHAFMIKIPDEYADGKEHVVEIVVKKSGRKLPNTFKIYFPKLCLELITFNINKVNEIIGINDVIYNSYKSGLFINDTDINRFFSGEKIIPLKFFEENYLNSAIYYEMGKLFAIKRELSKAEGFYSLALKESSFDRGIKIEHIGNLNIENGFLDHAEQVYSIASIENLDTTFYLYFNLASIKAKKGDYKKAIEILINGIDRFKVMTPYFANKIEEYIKEFYNKTLAELRGKIYAGEQKENILSWVIEEINFIYKTYEKILLLNNSTGLNKNNNENKFKVLIIAGSLDLPQCKRYRVEQKVEQLKKANIDVEVTPFNDIETNFEKVYDNNIIIIYRTPATPSLLKVAAIANNLGKITIYEIDDLIFDPEVYPPTIESFGGFVDVHLHNGLEYGMYLFNCMARFCDYGLASTRPLAEELAKLVRKKKAFIHRNALDSKNIFIKPTREKFEQKQEITIFYGSGTLSHNQDFIELVLPALERIFSEYNNVKLMIAGYLNLPQEFVDKFKNQLLLIPFTTDLRAYYYLLSKADINLAVLYDGKFEGCKSELKWLESATVGVPSIVSSTENYRDVIRHGVDGFIAKDSNDFYNYLKELIDNEELRYKMALNAYQRVIEEYSINKMAENIKNIFNSIINGENIKINSSNKKKKIAFVNVFFPPELIGGGTVIAYENIKVLIRDYKDKYDVVVFTSEAHHLPHVKPYTKEIYYWEDIKVYKVYPNFDEHIDWKYYDEKIKEIFKEFLDREKPDLVHFHAIQRLTASIAEACLEYGIPYVICAHDAWWISDWMFLTDEEGNVYPEGFPDIFSERPLRKGITLQDSIHRRLYLKYILENSAFFYTVSQEFANIYIKNGILNTHVIENGISEFINWEIRDTNYTKRLVLGFTGAFAIHKGYDLFHSVIEKINSEKLEVVLIDYSKPENWFSLGFIGKVPVRVYGAVDREKVNKFYKQIDVLVHPSKWPESYGLSPREALVSGCYTIVSSRTGALKDFISNEGAFIIEPVKEELEKIIIQILENPEKYKKPIQPSKLRKISEQVHELVEVYNKILG